MARCDPCQARGAARGRKRYCPRLLGAQAKLSAADREKSAHRTCLPEGLAGFYRQTPARTPQPFCRGIHSRGTVCRPRGAARSLHSSRGIAPRRNSAQNSPTFFSRTKNLLRCAFAPEETPLAPASVSLPLVRGRLSRPHQRRLCRPANEGATRFQRRGLRPRRGNFLPRLFSVSGSGKPGAGARRRPPLDLRFDDLLGHNLRLYVLCSLRRFFLFAAVSSRCRRSRILSRCNFLLALLVPR